MGLASPSHLIIVLVLILLLFGAKKIPELARGLGQGMKEFKAGVNDNEIGDDSRKDDSKDRRDENMVNSAASSPSESESTEDRRRETNDV